MRKRKMQILIAMLCAVLTALIIVAIVLSQNWTNRAFGFDRNVTEAEKDLRLRIVHQAEIWLGTNMASGSHREIIDIYNAHTPLAVGYKVSYTDKWCAVFVSTVAIECTMTDIIPTECGCQRQIALFEKLGRWEENDDYIPLPGDIIYYSSNDLDDEDCGGFSDHVGIVVGTADGYIQVIEGNYLGSVAYHVIKIGDSSIRGYGLPDYTSKAKENNGAA